MGIGMTQQQTTTFTPGPWGLAERSHGGAILVRGADYDAQKRHEQSHLQILLMADARLIAAAPELLAAMEAAREFIADGMAMGFVGMPEDENVLEVIEKAISKAKGINQ